MTHPSLARPGAIGLLLLAFFAGCASPYSQQSTPAKRIAENRPLFESWLLEIQNAVLDQKIQRGMTAEMVVMSLGRPTRVTRLYNAKEPEELWIYGTEVSPDSGRSGGTGLTIGGTVGGMQVVTDPMPVGGSSTSAAGFSENYREITFQNGIVTKAD